MRITGFKDVSFGTGLYYIDATILSLEPRIVCKIRFMVDSGCQITAVGFKDSLNLNIPIPSPTSSVSGVGGKNPTYPISNCSLAFNLIQSIHVERLTRLDILIPVITPENYKDIMRLPSVLGMDILSRYRVCFDGVFVTLEK